MNDEIDGFAEQLKIDMHIDIYNLIEESRNVPNILQRYTDLLRSETRKFNKVSIKMDELISKKFIYYMSEHNIKFNPSDARRMAEADEQVLKVKKIYNDLKETTTYLNNIMWNLKEKNKSISNIIQIKKMELG